MARVKGAMMTRKRRNKILKLAKGYWGAKSKHYKMANEQVMKSLQYAYTGPFLWRCPAQSLCGKWRESSRFLHRKSWPRFLQPYRHQDAGPYGFQ